MLDKKIIGKKKKFIEKAVKGNDCVLICGDTGVGKEVAARKIHRSSSRRENPFIPLNCASIPETLIESELFGHKKDSFTDAKKDKVGLIEAAKGGKLTNDAKFLNGVMPVKQYADLPRKDTRLLASLPWNN